MLKLRILSIGKTKENWLEEGCGEYLKRLKPKVFVQFLLAKNDEQLTEWAKKETSFLCLDPQGALMSSESFSKYLLSEWEKNGSEVTILIGGAEGIPLYLKQRGKLISLSPLTFTHQMTRLILLEQVYRALEIEKGSSYHK